MTTFSDTLRIVVAETITPPEEITPADKIKARRKLDRIIEMFGDDNGERLQPYYLAKLEQETMESRALSQFHNGTIYHPGNAQHDYPKFGETL